MTDAAEPTVSLSYEDAEALWEHWATDSDDILAHAAFERTLLYVADINREGLAFRPGGWVVDVPATVARVACAAAVLSASFEIAGLHDLEREIIIAAAGLVATMDLSHVRVTRSEQSLVDRLRAKHLAGTPITPAEARKALPRRLRQDVSEEQIADALDKLVAAGLADHDGEGSYVIRAAGGEAWMRISLRGASE